MSKYRVGVIGLRMGYSWAKAVYDNPETELSMVYDLNFEENERINHAFFRENTIVIDKENDIYNAGLDIIIIASPDHFHEEQSIKALRGGAHVICEKPLAPTVAACKRIINEVKKTKRFFMTGQVCRFAPAFVLAKKLVEEGRIGKLAFIESEYVHDYSKGAGGFNNWRKDEAIKREGVIGGGCHAIDLVRWFAGNPSEVFCYANRKLLPEWPTDDTSLIVAKFPDEVIGKILVSTGVRRPYSMRTVICGTRGTIICDNLSDHIHIYEDTFIEQTGSVFSRIPVNISSHNVGAEFVDFLGCLNRNEAPATDAYEGARTVALGEAGILSARTGQPVAVEII